MTEAGYSGAPLVKKLGLKPGQVVGFLNLPGELEKDLVLDPLRARLIAGEAEELGLTERTGFADLTPPFALRPAFDLIHAFYKSADRMRAGLPALRAAIKPAGTIWISWPKKASKVATDITEDVIRDAGLATGLVDVKVCAVTEVWSGLKLVIPVALRSKA